MGKQHSKREMRFPQVLFALVSNVEPGSRGWELLWEKRVLDQLMYVFAKGVEKEREADHQQSRNRKVTRGMKRGNQVGKPIYLFEPLYSTKNAPFTKTGSGQT